MRNQVSGNYLRMHRKKAGLSQRELGLLLGYGDKGQISRHERSRTAPRLLTALGYEVIFKASIPEIFPELHASVSREVEARLAAMEEALGQRSGRGRGANIVAQKLIWMMERRST
jgi:DNA-binding XRE family transcriptional regulator